MPRQWLEEGTAIVIAKMPTCFGDVSLRTSVDRSTRKVRVEAVLPRNKDLKTIRLALRAPLGWRLQRVTVNRTAWPASRVAGDQIDLSDVRGRIRLTASY